MTEREPQILGADATPQQTIGAIQDELTHSVLLSQTNRDLLSTGAALSKSVLLETDPGTGKTTIANALAEILGRSFGRVQGNPDLTPAQITGAMVFNQETRKMELHRGPLLSDTVLVDEIDDITSRALAAFTEAMAEGHVTIFDRKNDLSDSFMVMATRNHRTERTGANMGLWKARDRDRFAYSLEFPKFKKGERRTIYEIDHKPRQRVSDKAVTRVKQEAEEMAVSPEIHGYVDDLLEFVDKQPEIDAKLTALGSHRPYMDMLDMAKGTALGNGEAVLRLEHVAPVSGPVLRHRVALDPASGLSFDQFYARVAGEYNKTPAVQAIMSDQLRRLASYEN